MSSQLANKHALVTGGGRGIGLAIARELAGSGAKISVMSRSIEDTGDGFCRVRADVCDRSQVAAAFAAARDANGPIAILINNSGIAEAAPFKRTDRGMWDRIIGTNLTGTYLCTREAIDEMLDAQWGRIVNIASIAGLYGAPYISAYAASKHGVIGLTRALAAELQGSGVTANAVCPGYTDTAMMKQAIENIVKRTGVPESAARQELAQRNPGGRIVAAEEVASVVVELCDGTANGREVILPDERSTTSL